LIFFFHINQNLMVAFDIIHWIKAFLFLLQSPLFLFPLIYFVYGQLMFYNFNPSLHYAQLFTQKKLLDNSTSCNVAWIVPNSLYNASKAFLQFWPFSSPL
jgi:hypothetical protein